MRLNTGDIAPNFSKHDLNGEVVDVSALTKAGHVVWLGFFRYALCPLCNRRVHEMIGHWEARYKERCRFVAVFQSPVERFEGFKTKHQISFPVVADPGLELYKLYGVESSVVGALHPAVMLDVVKSKAAGYDLDLLGAKDGGALRVRGLHHRARRQAAHGAHVSDSLPFERADAALQALS